MPRARSSKTRADWIEAAARALEVGGVDAVRVEPLARRLGVTKGSFYWHFESREALLTAVLDAWEAFGTDAIIDEVQALEVAPEAALRALWTRTHTHGEELRRELAIRDLAQRDPDVRARVERVDERRLTFLVQLFRGLGLDPALAEARSLLLYSLLVGDVLIAGSGRAREAVLARAVDDLLRA